MAAILRVEGLGKAYQLGTLDRRSWWRSLRGQSRPEDLFWALRDVSFEIAEGEVVGFLGHNGAGKSTLLKILSQITVPTTGRVLMRGRTASLLEVGTGFHQELTGRDNVYLNGSILGMSNREVAARFDEIVAFSGVEEFIDTPVKRYSSGMRVRLAFAVAAHLEPEILIIDEVLAVGDAAFQSKCLGKIGEVSRSGRTVLFVSHNVGAIESLCTRGIVLERGRKIYDGTQTGAIAEYSRGGGRAAASSLRERSDRTGSGALRVVDLGIRGSDGQITSRVRSGEEIEVVFRCESREGAQFPRLSAVLYVTTETGAAVFVQSNWFTGDEVGDAARSGTIRCKIPRLPLPAGAYRIGYRLLAEMNGEVLDALTNACELPVIEGAFFTTGRVPLRQSGVCLVDAQWRGEGGAEVANPAGTR